MRYVATLRYDENLIRRAVMSFWRRTIGWKSVVTFGITVALFAWLIASGDRSWSIGVLGAALFFEAIFACLIYVIHLRQSMRKLRLLPEASATFVAEDDTFTMTSQAGTSTFPWSAIEDVWHFQDYWLLFFSRSQFATMPLSDVPPDMQAFVLERVSKGGAKHVR
jgi:hypothetical protein